MLVPPSARARAARCGQRPNSRVRGAGARLLADRPPERGRAWTDKQRLPPTAAVAAAAAAVRRRWYIAVLPALLERREGANAARGGTRRDTAGERE